MKPLVSIVINNYNYGRFLAQAVDSALAQTYEATELIVVDDGSTDDSRAVLEPYRSRAKVIEKTNGGQASAFNAGIALAQGEYILLLDADDRLLPEAVERCVAAFPEGYSRIFYRLKPIDEAGNEITGIDPETFHFRRIDGDMYRIGRETGDFSWPPTSANFFDARKLKQVLPVPEQEYRICADAYVLAWTGVLGPVRAIDMRLAEYRLHGANGWAALALQYADSRRLRTRIDHHYQCRALLSETCRASGFEYRDTPDTGYYTILKSLCVAYRAGIDSAHVQCHTRGSLARMAISHLWHGGGGIAGRVSRVAYLLGVLMLPRWASSWLVGWADARERRRLLPST